LTEPEGPERISDPVAAPASEPVPAPVALAPVAGAERVTEIDVVRGFALLGILLMNIEYFNRPFQELERGLDASLHGLDRIAGWFVMAFVQGKFYTLFSILFGMGFAILLDRTTSRGRPFGGFFTRRLLVLAAIGAIHGFLIWPGDILLVYAVCGFPLLLFFRKTPARRLPKWGLPLIFLPLVGMWANTARIEAARAGNSEAYQKIVEDQQTHVADLDRESAEAAEQWAHGSYLELAPRRSKDMLNQLVYLPAFGFTLVGLFLLGAWFVRSGVILRPAEHLGFYRGAFGVGLGAGVPLAVVAMESGYADGFTEVSWRLPWSATIMEIANLALAFAYLSGLVLLMQRPGWRERLRPLAAAGRMALTNYLLQSIIATTLFYGYGFALFGRVPRAAQIPLTLAIFALNLWFSTVWLARFRFGPAEWLWRSLTYGRLQPLRR